MCLILSQVYFFQLLLMPPRYKTWRACSYYSLSSSKVCPSFFKMFVFSDEEVNCRVATSTVLLQLVTKVEQDLLTFSVIDVTLNAQISVSKVEQQPRVENLEAVKIGSSWEDKQDAKMTFLEATNS